MDASEWDKWINGLRGKINPVGITANLFLGSIYLSDPLSF